LLQNLLGRCHKQTRYSLNQEIINLNNFFEHALSMSQEVAKIKNIALTINIPSDHFITADRNMLETVFRNIISNATKFTEAKDKFLFLLSQILKELQ
jgi:signal transduction histidine kinase